MDIISKLIQWFFTNVFLSLLPLMVTLLFISMFKEEERKKWDWISLFKDGELFLFSSTISATSMGDLTIGNTLNEAKLYTFLGLLIILLVSTIIFGCVAYKKLEEQLLQVKSSTSLMDESRFSYGSIACAIASTMLGYVAFFQSGG